MTGPLSREHARTALHAAVCLFAAALPLSIAGANIGWGLILAALLACALSGVRVPAASCLGPLTTPLVLFLAVSLATAALGIDPGHSFRFVYQDAHKLWLYSLLSLALALEPSPRALGALALGAAAAAVTGIGQAAASLWGPDVPARAHAFVHPVTFGEQMGVLFIGAVCFLLPSDGGRTRPSIRRAAWAAAIVTGAALLLSDTRGALISTGLGIIAMLAIRRRTRRIALVVIPVLLLALGTMEIYRSDRSLLADFMGLSGLPIQRGQRMRIVLWKAALRMGRDHPWTGVGLNNYRTAFPEYYQGMMEDRSRTWGTAHNIYLHHFAERGIPGVAVLLLLLWTFWFRSLRRSLERPDAWNQWAFGTATAFLFMNMTEVALQVEVVWMLVFFVWVWAETRHQAAERKAHG